MSNENEFNENEANCELPDDEISEVSGGSIFDDEDTVKDTTICSHCKTKTIDFKTHKCTVCGRERWWPSWLF